MPCYGCYCYIIHREHLASKEMSLEMNAVFNSTIKIVKFIKSSSKNSQLLKVFCNEVEYSSFIIVMFPEYSNRIMEEKTQIRSINLSYLEMLQENLGKYFPSSFDEV